MGCSASSMDLPGAEGQASSSQGAAAAFLGEALRPLFLREPRATVAILARYAEQADGYYEALQMAEIPNLRRVRDYDFTFRPGVDMTEIRQVIYASNGTTRSITPPGVIGSYTGDGHDHWHVARVASVSRRTAAAPSFPG